MRPGVCVCVCVWGGGGYSQFSMYVGLDSASTVYPKHISGISGIPQKTFEILRPPKNIPILYLDLKMYRNEPPK